MAKSQSAAVDASLTRSVATSSVGRAQLSLRRGARRLAGVVILACIAVLGVHGSAEAAPVTYYQSGSPGLFLNQDGYIACSGAAFNGTSNPLGGPYITSPAATVGLSPAWAGHPQGVYERATVQIWTGSRWVNVGSTPWQSTSILDSQNAASFERQAIRIAPEYSGRWFRISQEFRWYVDGVGLVGAASDFFTADRYLGPNATDLHPGGACRIGG